ncbi:hypothetical protein D3C84_803950 [compost metagenome]
MRLVGIADARMQVVVVGYDADTRYVEDEFFGGGTDLFGEAANQFFGTQAVGELALEARHQYDEFFHRHQRVQRLVVGLAVEGSGDAFLGERAQLFGGAQLCVQEDVAAIDGFFEVSFVLKLIDVQIHGSSPEYIESLKSRPHVSKLKCNPVGGGPIKAQSPEFATKSILQTKKIPL